jgi:hypothetical protein
MCIRPILAVLILLATASAAGAATTYSPPVRSSMGDNLGCKLLNLSGAAVEVASELEDGLGNVVDAQTFAIPAGESRLMARSSSAIFGGFCRFTFEGAASQVRGYITLEDAGGSDTRLLYPASPIDGLPPVGTTTFSPPVRSSMGDNLGCRLLNLSDADLQVSSQLHNGLGAVVDTQAFVIPAGQGRLMARSSEQVFGAYCSFTFEGDPSAVRGYITLEDAGGSNTRLLYPASAAPPAEATPTATATAGDPTPTATVDTTPAVGCCGDCNLDGEVLINELIIAVNNALDGCPN